MSTYNNDPKQTMWETWFIISVILFITSFCIGTLENSVQMFPNFRIWFGISCINLIYCVHIGLKQ